MSSILNSGPLLRFKVIKIYKTTSVIMILHNALVDRLHSMRYMFLRIRVFPLSIHESIFIKIRIWIESDVHYLFVYNHIGVNGQYP